MTPNMIEAAPIAVSVDTMDPGSLREAYKVLANENQALLCSAAHLREERDSFQRVGIALMENRDELAGLLQQCWTLLNGATEDLQNRIDAALAKHGEHVNDMSVVESDADKHGEAGK